MTDESSRRRRRPPGNQRIDDLPPAVFRGRAVFEGARVALEPLDPRRHAAELYTIGHRDERARDLWTFLPYGPFADEREMTLWLRGSAASADPLFFVTRDRTSGALIGMQSFLAIRPLAGVVEIGHVWFAPRSQKTAQATEALYLMMRHAMDELGYRRLEWKCDALNRASRAAALRLGFRFEGVFLNHMVVKGRNRDTAWYALIDEEWPPVRDAIAGWLAPDTFDAAGRQRTALSQLTRRLW